MQLAATLVGVAAVGVLAWRWRADNRAWQLWRGNLLRSCEGLLSNIVRSEDTAGWPRLDGVFDEFPVTVELLLDDSGYRKLPVLWLRVSVRAHQHSNRKLCATARPNSSEYWSMRDNLNERLPPPPSWPSEVALRSDTAAALSAGLVANAAEFFANPVNKELEITAHRVRVTSMVMQSRRAEYLVLRAPRFESEAVTTSQALALLQHAASIARAGGATNSRSATHVA